LIDTRDLRSSDGLKFHSSAIELNESIHTLSSSSVRASEVGIIVVSGHETDIPVASSDPADTDYGGIDSMLQSHSYSIVSSSPIISSQQVQPINIIKEEYGELEHQPFDKRYAHEEECKRQRFEQEQKVQ